MEKINLNPDFGLERFREINKRFNLTEKDLRKAAKAQNMVTFYGAGGKTGVLNVEGKLAKVLDKQENTLVVKAAYPTATLPSASVIASPARPPMRVLLTPVVISLPALEPTAVL